MKNIIMAPVGNTDEGIARMMRAMSGRTKLDPDELKFRNQCTRKCEADGEWINNTHSLHGMFVTVSCCLWLAIEENYASGVADIVERAHSRWSKSYSEMYGFDEGQSRTAVNFIASLYLWGAVPGWDDFYKRIYHDKQRQ